MMAQGYWKKCSSQECYGQSILRLEKWGLAPCCSHAYLFFVLRLPSFHGGQGRDPSNTSCTIVSVDVRKATLHNEFHSH